ncbi:MAG: RNA pseudouridine synthase, partial [Clostridia bacterium]|nr:RNA pseudouridine synthase [Clostridia bacterium]
EKGEYFAVHRLDRNTQGLIVFAKNKGAEAELLSAFKERRVIKTYIALCKNRFKEESATLTAYLKKDEKSASVKIYDKEVPDSVKIITQYSLVEKRGDIALVRITLHTGRTHQIRAHFAHVGCPVLGDGKYGDEALNKKYGFKRQCLISKILAFCFTGKLSYLNGKSFISGFEF